MPISLGDVPDYAPAQLVPQKNLEALSLKLPNLSNSICSIEEQPSRSAPTMAEGSLGGGSDEAKLSLPSSLVRLGILGQVARQAIFSHYQLSNKKARAWELTLSYPVAHLTI